MGTVLVKNIHTLVTMDRDRRELRNAAIFVRDQAIAQVGLTEDLPKDADQVLDLQGRHIVMPGLVNTHHHFYQTLTKVVPDAQNCDLFNWLKTLYPIWSKLTAEGVYVSAQMAAAELMLSGCTTASDHLYIYPNDCTLDDEIAAMKAIGIRFHASRGSMSVGESLGGLPPDSLVEKEADILKDSQRLIEQYHDSSRYAMLRMTLAPCSPFSVSPDLMRESAAMARSYTSVRLHTHLAENQSDIDYSLQKFGMNPEDYAESVGWLGNDVWHAHCVKLSDHAIAKFGRTGTGVAHCPCSNCRLGSGIAPVRAMQDAGVKVGLGVDGSASNDAGNLAGEMRMAMLLQRVARGADAMSAREALEIATLGGAKVLGRGDCGSLEVGKRADVAVWDMRGIAAAGAWDPVAALVLCGPQRVRDLWVEGRQVVRDGQMATVDLGRVIERQTRLAQRLAG